MWRHDEIRQYKKIDAIYKWAKNEKKKAAEMFELEFLGVHPGQSSKSKWS